MSSKYSDSKSSSDVKPSAKGSKGGYDGDNNNGGGDDEEIFYADEKNSYGDEEQEKNHFPQVNVTDITIRPNRVVEVTSALSLDIKFELDRDVVAAFWKVQLLVDSAHSRIIQVLGQTEIQDYTDGESDMHFEVDRIDISHIAPSTLTNSGLLMATFVVDDEEVATVNMVSRTFCVDCVEMMNCVRWCKYIRRMERLFEKFYHL
jgi:hypothetical protein